MTPSNPSLIKKLPISAVVVSHNEGNLLKESLPPLFFCEQLIVINLESQDDTVEIAKNNGAEVWNHSKVPIVEIIHSRIKEKVTYDWILITDPDEVLSDHLREDIIKVFSTLGPEIGAITVPMKYYFKDRCLKGTFWGGIRSRVYLIHKDRFSLSEDVHTSRKIRKGFSELSIPFTGENFLHHYWMQSYSQLFEKHWRYLEKEGEARFNKGERTSLLQILKTPLSSFRMSFLRMKGYQDGMVGLFLSLFWAWYQSMALASLFKYQKNQ